MTTPPKDYPITGVCVVADPAKCPPGYELLFYSEDKRDDCDLWKDSLFKARVTRYLCYTRVFPLDGGRLNNVLADLVVQNEKELPPSGYSLIENTVDSGERATRKKQVSVKMIPRASTTNAVTELIIMSKSKRAPTGYTIAGEINGLLLCFKYGNVPASQAPPVNNSASGSSLNNSQTPNYFQNRSALVAETTQGTAAPPVPNRPQNHVPSHPLSGVPFQISPRYATSGAQASIQQSLREAVPKINYRSFADLDSEYNYPFRLERGIVNKYL